MSKIFTQNFLVTIGPKMTGKIQKVDPHRAYRVCGGGAKIVHFGNIVNPKFSSQILILEVPFKKDEKYNVCNST